MRVTLTTTFGCYPLLNTTGSLPVHMLAVIRPSGVRVHGASRKQHTECGHQEGDQWYFQSIIITIIIITTTITM